MRTFFNIYRNILLVIAVFLAMVMILPLAFQVKPYIVLSPSMEPTIHTGDVCYIQKYEENKKPEIGNIVAFTLNDNETMFVHRVVDVKDGYYITQGDANDTADLYQPSEEAIVGKAVFIIPYLGTIVSWAKSSQGLIVMIVAVLISILSSFLDTDEKKEKKKKQKAKAQENKEPDIFTEKYNEVKAENSTNARSLSDIVNEQREVRAEMIRREQNEWIDDIFKEDFDEIKNQDVQLFENNLNSADSSNEEKCNELNTKHNEETEVCIESEAKSIENSEKGIELKEKSIELEEEQITEDEFDFDFDNLSVEEETRKLFEKHSVIVSEESNDEQDISYLSMSKIGLNNTEDENIANVEDEETFDVSKYAEKYLGDELDNITAETLLFDTEGVSADTKKWAFMVDDEDSEFTEKYRESVTKSVKRKLESETYNNSDNFSPAAILKRAQEALEDDLTDEENDIMNILTVDDINIDIKNEEKPE